MLSDETYIEYGKQLMRADSPPFFNFSRRLAVVPNCSHDERRGTTDVSFNTTARHANWPVIVLTGILTLAGCNPTAGPQDSATHGPTMDSADAVSLSPTSDASGETDNDTVMSEPIDDSSDGVPAANPPVESRVNRLAHETSPYLLQHARNPVDWHPWGEEALAKAKQENKLIFLSIGYSSCHWCHVMERESFMDSEIARYLNEHFICIKVDREERPDVDNIYMLAVQLITRRGGWPLSVFLTPDAQPFFGGTYFPARDNDRPGATGFLTVIQRVAEVWRDNPAEVRRSGQQLAAAIRESMAGESATSAPALTRTAIDGALHDLAEDFDPRYGGFGYNEVAPDTPKFPQAANLFLLAHVARNESPSSDNEQPPAEEPASPPSAASPASTRPQPQAREMLLKTLDQIAMGGIRDHLGGGFHRYAVDRYWHIPHFEKMLYDNGQLASVYAEAYALTGNPAYARVLDEMFVFLNREMSSPEGGFYAAIDADSEHEEGKFYRWQRSQWDTILGADAAATFAQVYAADGQPNFEQQYYVPLLTTPFAELATARQLSAEQLDDLLAPLRQQLFDVRAQRVRPATDTKILTSWNGMMIRGLADAGRLLERPDYVQRAARAAQFVLKNLQDEQGRLRRTFSAGEARLNAYVDDYACFIDGLLALHRATGETHWLEAAEALTEKQIELFWDTEHGGFFFTSGDHEALIVRGKQLIDNAVPAGNSVAAENLVYLGDVLDRTDYLDYAERTIQVAGSLLVRAPAAAPRLLVAFDQLLQLPPREPK